MKGPFGGVILDLVSNDHFQFIATSNGIFRSADQGRHWIQLPFDSEVSYTCDEIGIFKNELVVRAVPSLNTSGPYHLFKSVNNGDSWVDLPSPGLMNPSQIAINNYGIYLKGVTEMMFSTDGGSSWHKSNLVADQGFIYRMETIDGHIYAASKNTIFKSALDSDDWTSIVVDSMEGTISTFHVFDNVIFVQDEAQEKLFRSIDGGDIWTYIHNDNWGFGWTNIVKTGDEFIGCGTYTFFKSTDVGATWEVLSTVPSIETLRMITAGDTILAGTFGGGMLISIDAGQTFDFSNEGLDASYVGKIATDSTFIWASNGFGGIWKQNRNTAQWEMITSISEVFQAVDIETQQQNVFALNDQYKLYNSSDGGISWTNVTPPPSIIGDNTISEIYVNDPSVLVGGSNDNGYPILRITQDTGKSWGFYPVLIDDQLFYPSFFTKNSNKIFTCEAEKIFRSTDNGDTWDFFHYGLYFDPGCHQCSFTRLFSSDDMLYMVEMDKYYHSTKLHASNTDSMSWHIVDFGFPGSGFNSGLTTYATVGNILLASDYFEGRGVFVSFDGGASSVEFNEGLPTKKIGEITSDDKYIYVATGGFGLWRRKISDLDIVSTQPITQTNDISIYPNPSNGNFTLNLDSNISGDAKLMITDISGKVCFTRDIFLKPQTKVDASTLPSGLYFLSIRSGDKFYTGKIVVQK
ncbi:MAG: T9SS type A sorting domain-containing protein [Saprospiraceae bacterium]